MVIEARSLSADDDCLEIDPFGFWPERASRFGGLGGDVDGGDPNYGFHTPYVGCGTGEITFTVKVAGLTADRGTLILRIFEFPNGSGTRARQVAIGQIRLVDLDLKGGEVELGASANSLNTYAVLGGIYGDVEARADSVSVTICRRPAGPASLGAVSEDRGSTSVRQVGALSSQEPPMFDTPVSQPCTASQLLEPVFVDRNREFGKDVADPLEGWARAFVLHAMDKYQVVRPGARGFSLGGGQGDVAALLEGRGCIVTTSAHRDSAEDPMAALGRETDFDFCWSLPGAGLDQGWPAYLDRIELWLTRIVRGGVAVHVMPFDDLAHQDREGVLTPQHAARAALLLISRGHQVAQIRLRADDVVRDDGELTAFALIVRKGG